MLFGACLPTGRCGSAAADRRFVISRSDAVASAVLLLLFCVWRRDVTAVGRNDKGGWFAVLVVACYFAKCLRYNAQAATCESGESSPHSKLQQRRRAGRRARGGHYVRLEASQGQLTVAGPAAEASIPATVYEEGSARKERSLWSLPAAGRCPDVHRDRLPTTGYPGLLFLRLVLVCYLVLVIWCLGT